MVSSDAAAKVLVLNPVSGNRQHADTVRQQAIDRGFSVRETSEAGDAIAIAQAAAADGAELIAAAGGDGTVTEVVRGVDAAAALDRVTIGVVPTGTGNNFAENIGITGIDQAFAALETGERRALDLGMANDVPFVNSCVGGLTADASAETTSEQKQRLGVAAYVLNTLRAAQTFEGLRLTVEIRDGDARESSWSGDAICVLIGNARRFTTSGSLQADLEDGRFDVMIIEDVSTVDLMSDAVAERLFGGESAHTVTMKAAALELTVRDRDPVTFSLDGEMIESRELSLRVRPKALHIPVGATYDPTPIDGQR